MAQDNTYSLEQTIRSEALSKAIEVHLRPEKADVVEAQKIVDMAESFTNFVKDGSPMFTMPESATNQEN